MGVERQSFIQYPDARPAPTSASNYTSGPSSSTSTSTQAPGMNNAEAERSGVCAGLGYQNLGWQGMSKNECIDRAIKAKSTGSCAYLSFAPNYMTGQTGCWCFKADECEHVKDASEQDSDWKTWKVDGNLRIAVESLSDAPTCGTLAYTSVALLILNLAN